MYQFTNEMYTDLKKMKTIIQLINKADQFEYEIKRLQELALYITERNEDVRINFSIGYPDKIPLQVEPVKENKTSKHEDEKNRMIKMIEDHFDKEGEEWKYVEAEKPKHPKHR